MDTDKPEMVFVSAPYNDFERSVTEERVRRVAVRCGRIFLEGKIPVTPVLMGHEIVKHCNIDSTFKEWKSYSLGLIERCDRLEVLCLDGWEAALGVKQEIDHARKHGVRVAFHDPVTGVTSDWPKIRP